ncbi:MAG: alpha-galactosidase [Myxococcota bacterium]|nr:alpha-galactosidase [Myxococcota bacterium]
MRWSAVLIPMLVAPVFVPTSAAALDNGVARTPPMGWNSWNRFQCDVSEGLIKQMADALVTSGLRDAGYVYLNIDDCWQGGRDTQGLIQPDPSRFPSGMKVLSNYVHGKGMKFGLYSDAGIQTCAKRAGSHGFEQNDARQYAAWGVDYLKYDWCSTDGLKAEDAYGAMRDALLKTGRPIVFSICEWGKSQPWLWAAPVGNLWRTTGDIGLCWDKKACRIEWVTGVMNILDLQVGLEEAAGPGHWNDPDMLQVGNGLTDSEDRAHFSLWALLAAPLLAGNDVRHMSDFTRETLTNREVIAVDQDPLGIQGRKIRDDGAEEVWAKPLTGGAMAVVLLNRGDAAVRIRFGWTELGWPTRPVSVRDLWREQDLGSFRDAFSAEVAAHGVVMMRLTPTR